MGMSTRVIGFTPPDETWRKMKAIWDSCKDAGVPIPLQVIDFFNDEEPNPNGVKVKLPVTEWKDDSSEGFELKVSDIPPHVHVIRFYNSW